MALDKEQLEWPGYAPRSRKRGPPGSGSGSGWAPRVCPARPQPPRRPHRGPRRRPGSRPQHPPTLRARPRRAGPPRRRPARQLAASPRPRPASGRRRRAPWAPVPSPPDPRQTRRAWRTSWAARPPRPPPAVSAAATPGDGIARPCRPPPGSADSARGRPGTSLGPRGRPGTGTDLPQGRDQQSPPFRTVFFAEELVRLRRLLHGPGGSASASGAARGPGRAGGLTGRARAASPRRPPPPPAGAAGTAEAARGRRRRVGGGSGGGFLGRGGLASLRVGGGSAAAREPDDPQLRPSRRPAFPAARARSSGGSSSFVWVRNPARGTADLAPAPAPATAGAGGERRRRLVASSPPPRPPHRQRRPARPSQLQRALGTERACAAGGRASERATLWRAPCRPAPPPLSQPRTAAELPAPAVAARPAPWARRSLSRVAGEAPHGACAPRRWRRRRPVAGLRRRGAGGGSRPVLGARSRRTTHSTVLYTNAPFSRPSQDSPDSVPL